MRSRLFSRRAGAWLLWLALLAGPIGPGGAWHVATLDALGVSGHGARVSDTTGKSHQVPHGPSCQVCQTLNGVRAILPTVAVLHGAPQQAAPILPAAACPPGQDSSRHSTSRAPPLA